jgi:NADPH2:quinone reductase
MAEVTTNQATTNRGWRLRRHPAGALATGDLELVTVPIVPLQDGQALVRTLVLSVEAASRIWLGHQRAFMPSVPVGEVMRGIGVGEVIASRRADLSPGDVVAGFLGWQEFCVADDRLLEAPLATLPSPLPAPASAFVGVLGHIGISAYLGDLCRGGRRGVDRWPAGQAARRPGCRHRGRSGQVPLRSRRPWFRRLR